MNRFSIAAVVCTLVNFAFPLHISAQDADVGVPVQPSPHIRLTGILKMSTEPQASAFPTLQVWIAGKQETFHVTRVEPVIPAYPAEEELRKVSGLGLRLLAENNQLAALQSPDMHNRPITIEGTLRVRDGLLLVQSVKVATENPGDP